jgi:lipopolysaccharide exporter
VCTLLLTRWLAPAEQGEVNVAYVCLATASMAASLGVQPYVVSHPHAPRSAVVHASFVALVGAALLLGATWALSRPLTSMLGAPQSARYFTGFAIALLLDRISVLPRAVLARDLQFRAVGARMAAGELTYAATSVGLASLGFGGDAIVLGSIARSVLVLSLFASRVDRREYLDRVPLDRARFRELLAYGAPLAAGALFHLAASSWDNLVVYGSFGAATLGLYNQAYRLADLPATQLGEQLGDLLVPTFARLDDRSVRQRLLERAFGAMGLVVFPLAVGLSAIAPTLVGALLPAPYAGVAPLLAVLGVLGIVRPVSILGMGYLQAVGRTRSFALLDATKLVAVLGAMSLLAPLGPSWAAAGVGLGYALHAVLMLRAIGSDGYALRPLLLPMLRSLVACAPLALGVVACRASARAIGLSAPTSLALEIGAGTFGYLVGLRLVAWDLSIELVALVAQRKNPSRVAVGCTGSTPSVTGAASE